MQLTMDSTTTNYDCESGREDEWRTSTKGLEDDVQQSATIRNDHG
jgi:hypothetical protein